MRYYYIKVEDQIRCEKATGPRQACLQAFGVIYDRASDTAVYKDIGTTVPRNLSNKKLQELKGPEGWLRIPSSGK